MNPEDNTLIDSTREGDTTPMQRKKPQTPRRQQRKELQVQERTTNVTVATVVENTKSSTGFASDFTYEAPQAPSRATWSAISRGHMLPSFTIYIPQILRDHAFNRYLFAAVNKANCNARSIRQLFRKKRTCSAGGGMAKTMQLVVN